MLIINRPEGLIIQMEDPKNTKGIVKREVTQIVSAGTLTSPEIVNEKDFNYIASITDFNYVYALSYADLLSGKVCATYAKRINHGKNRSDKYVAG